MIYFAIVSFLVLFSCIVPHQLSSQVRRAPSIPASFIQNTGQWSPDVRFMASVRGMNVWLTDKGLMYDVYQSMPRVSLLSDALGDERRSPSDALGDERLGGSTTQKPRASLGSDTLGRRRIGHVIAMELVGANRGTTPIGTDAHPSTRNYFIGNNPDKWRTNIPSFGKGDYTRCVSRN